MSDNLIFADGIESLAFDKGLVKMDFFSNKQDLSSEDENAQVHMSSGRLIIHVEDFADFYNALTNLANTLEERKIIEKQSSEEPEEGSSEDFLKSS